MAVAKKPKTQRAKKRDARAEAAVVYFAARSHEAWRRRLIKTNPEQKGRPRMRLRDGTMVDVNQPWPKLHPNARADNMRAAYDAYDAIEKFPEDREAAADYVHKCWIKRNRGDATQPKELFKPYRQLSEIEKDKDRAHVDAMKAALAAVRTKVKRSAREAVYKIVKVEAKSWARLDRAAKMLSKQLGRPVAPEALLQAGIASIVSVCGVLSAEAKAKKS